MNNIVIVIAIIIFIIAGLFLFKNVMEERFRIHRGGRGGMKRGRPWGRRPWGRRPYGYRYPYYNYTPIVYESIPSYIPVHDPERCFCDKDNLTYNGCGSNGQPLCYGDQCYCNKCECKNGKVKSKCIKGEATCSDNGCYCKQ